MVQDFEKLWKDTLVEIELNTSRANFITWFKHTNIAGAKDGTVFVNVPNGFVKEWLAGKYHKFILRSLHSLQPAIKNIEYCIVSKPAAVSQEEASAKAAQPLAGDEQLSFEEFQIDKEANLNPKYTLESFIVGPFNEVAYAAATAITKNPGATYNPLFIYGGVGLGKTHLLQAIGNKIRELKPGAKILYLTSEKFASDFINAVQNKNIYDFKEKYRRYNLLIIDDIQFFSDKLKIQEEFFHIFNSLYERNYQLVFSSDRTPKHIVGLEERLRSRFEGGMMIDIAKPEFESRLAILQSKSEQRGFPIDQEILEYIASAIQENIRELEGALNSIICQSKIKGKILSLNEIREIIKKNAKPVKTLTFSEILKSIADFYEITEKELFEKTRKKEIVKPRQVAMYLLREDLSISYPYIGRKFGQRDHTTVIHAYKKINKEIKTDNRLIDEIKQIREIIKEKSV